jgi:hypothetical protein
MDSETEAVVVTCIRIEEEDKKRKEAERKRRRKRHWVHNINRKRSVFGEFSTLFPDLL